jgi:hypothetical protein
MKPSTQLLLAAVTVGVIAVLVVYKLQGAQKAAGVGLLAAALLAAALGVAATRGATVPAEAFGGKESESERKVRTAFQEVCGKKFPTSLTLLPPYEIDGYNDELKLGFEYQGPYHYMNLPLLDDKSRIVISPLTRGVDAWDPSTFSLLRLTATEAQVINANLQKKTQQFAHTQATDSMKKLVLRGRGITLIVIPYTVTNRYRTNQQLKDYVASRLQDAGLGDKVIYQPRNYLPVIKPPDLPPLEYHIVYAPEWDPAQFQYPFTFSASTGGTITLLSNKQQNCVQYYDGQSTFYKLSDDGLFLNPVQEVYAIASRPLFVPGFFDMDEIGTPAVSSNRNSEPVRFEPSAAATLADIAAKAPAAAAAAAVAASSNRNTTL